MLEQNGTRPSQAEVAHGDGADKYRGIAETAKEGVWILNAKNRTIFINKKMAEMLGYPISDMMRISPLDLTDWQNRPILQKKMEQCQYGAIDDLELRFRRKDGSELQAIIAATPIFDSHGHFAGSVAMVTDIHERGKIEAALRESEERFRATFDQAAVGIAHVARDGRFLRLNRRYCEILGYTYDELIKRTFQSVTYPDDVSVSLSRVNQLINGEIRSYFLEKRYVRPDGSIRWVHVTTSAVHGPDGSFKYLIPVIEDITEQKLAEEALIEKEKNMKAILNASLDEAFLIDIDGNVLAVNDIAARRLGRRPEEIIGKNMYSFYQPQVARERRERVSEVISTRKPIRYEEERNDLYFDHIKYPIVDSSGNVIRLAVFSRDVTSLKQAEKELKQKMIDLERSNSDLERFAYVASHDLQEPLRMVASYVKLLDRRYKDKLDQDAQDYIGFAAEGATRMQQMINDLLAYSRVGTKGKPLEPTDLEAVLSRAMRNLDVAIKENDAIVTHASLPTVLADDVQMIQLFQNLIGNALKFKSDKQPRVHVSAELKGNEWQISVHDNGIGIAPQYFERIFIIFQRLHTRTDYPGSGIGLAICKKIIERHGGRIWVESTPGEGSTFYFTIPIYRSGV